MTRTGSKEERTADIEGVVQALEQAFRELDSIRERFRWAPVREAARLLEEASNRGSGPDVPSAYIIAALAALLRAAYVPERVCARECDEARYSVAAALTKARATLDLRRGAA